MRHGLCQKAPRENTRLRPGTQPSRLCGQQASWLRMRTDAGWKPAGRTGKMPVFQPRTFGGYFYAFSNPRSVPVPEPKDETRDRFAPLPSDSAVIAEWRKRMKTDEAKEIYKHRAQTIECVNAQARNHGLIRLLVRGVEKVRAVALWHAIAHNVRRWFSLRGEAALAG